MTNDDGLDALPRGQAAPQPGYSPASPYPISPAESRKPRWPWIVAVIIAVTVALVAIGGYAITRGGSARTVTVTYEVTGDPGSVDIRYKDAEGHLSGPQIVSLPWQTQIAVPKESKRLLAVQAQRKESSRSPLMCRITSNDTSIDRQQSVGTFVGCGGFLGQN